MSKHQIVTLECDFLRRRVCSIASFSRRRDLDLRRGSAVLELVVVIPILLTLGMGMCEFGAYLNMTTQFENAARDGARAAKGWNASMSDVTNAVSRTMATTGINFGGSGYSIALTDSAGTTISSPSSIPAGSNFSVTVSANWGVVGAGVRPLGLIGSGKRVTSRCLMRKEF